VQIVQQEGLGLDVVSGGELYTAIKAGFPMEEVYFHGNNKTIDELELAIDNNVRRIVVDNRQELLHVNRIAAEKGKTVNISFRIKPELMLILMTLSGQVRLTQNLVLPLKR